MPRTGGTGREQAKHGYPTCQAAARNATTQLSVVPGKARMKPAGNISRGLAGLCVCAVLWSQPGSCESSFLTGNWGGLRDTLAGRGLDIELVATVDVVALVDGGVDRGVEAPSNFDLVFTLDTAAAGLWQDGSLLLYFLGNAGGAPSRRVGDLQVTSNIEAVNTVKLYEASYEHHFLDDRASLLLGLHDLNSDFYVLEHAGLFLNSSFGIGVEVAQVGPSIFSATALAARLRVNPAGDAYLLGAIYDGVPGDPDEAAGTRISLAEGDGVFVVGEAGFSGDTTGYYKAAVGGWYHTAEFDDVGGTTENANGGVYLIGERDLWRGEDGRGAGGFVQLGFADDGHNQTGTYIGAGLTWTGPLRSRSADVVGLAVAHARNGDRFRRFNPAAARAETVIEWSYLLAPVSWMTIQPDVQYVINPATSRDIDDALVIGVRLQLSL